MSSVVVELNVGGVIYATTRMTVTKYPDSLLGQLFLLKQPIGEQQQADACNHDNVSNNCSSQSLQLIPDSKGRYFIDRDGVLFRYVLDFLRTGKLTLPENFHERDRLTCEAEYFRLTAMVKVIGQLTQSPEVVVSSLPGHVHHRPLSASISAPISDGKDASDGTLYCIVLHCYCCTAL